MKGSSRPRKAAARRKQPVARSKKRRRQVREQSLAAAIVRQTAPQQPIAQTVEQKTWEEAVVALVGFLLRVRTTTALHGEKWAAGMRRYYRSRLDPLLDKPPAGMEDKAAHFREQALDL